MRIAIASDHAGFELKQFLVNRITFTGNTTTHDTVARREIRLYEGGIFAMNQLKYSIRRLNQLGYFKPLEGEAIDVQKAPTAEGEPPQVDVRLKFEEQNRNQITFGAGVSKPSCLTTSTMKPCCTPW